MPLIRERNGIYYADEWVPDRGKKRRKRIRRSSGTRDKDQAREWYAKLTNDIWRQEKLGERPSYSWGKAVVAYMRGREDRASHTHDESRAAWLHEHLGHIADIREIDADLIERIKLARRAEVSAATTNRLLTFLRVVLNHAVALDWLAKAPRVALLELPERKPTYLEAEEVDALLRVLNAPRTKHLVDFVTLAVDCGLRMRNVTHLKWTDIDVRGRCIWIEKHNTKGRRHVAIPLTAAAFDVIQRCMGAHHVYVLTHRGKPYDRVNQRTLQRAAEAAGIHKHITPHVLRHTFATRMIKRGVSVFELMELGGWSKLESVQIYTHFSPERLRDTAERGSHFASGQSTAAAESA